MVHLDAFVAPYHGIDKRAMTARCLLIDCDPLALALVPVPPAKVSSLSASSIYIIVIVIGKRRTIPG